MSKTLNATLNFKTFSSQDKNLQGYLYGEDTSEIDYVLVHGFGDHFMRYSDFLELMVSAGHTVAGLDLLGYGRSEGKRGSVNEFQDYIKNFEDFLSQDWVSSKLTERTKFIGFSMGGNIVTQYLLKHQPKNKTYLVSPMFSLIGEASGNLQKIIDSVEKIMPNLNIYTGIIPPQEIYRDPLAHANLSAQLARAIVNNQGSEFIDQLGQIEANLVVIHSKLDPLCEFSGSEKFVDRQPRAQLVAVDSIRHELLLAEPEKSFALIQAN